MKYLLLTISIFSSVIFPQFGHNHPELDWKTLESEHFLIHYHNGTERTAYEAMEIAEFVYEPVTSMYNFYPDSKTHIVIKDTDDFSNGSAYFFDNKIEIWANPLDYDLRGSHRWVQNVITHEFVHIIQLGASLKYNRHFPALYVQGMGYEKEKRKDVLYGYPNSIISYAIPSVSVPPWFAEGVAQNMYNDANYDFWDTHRDMILRDAFLNNTIFEIHEMSSFGKTGIGNEQIYNQGFSIVSYLSDRFGSGIERDISIEISKPLQYSFSSAIKNVTDYDFKEIYNDWYSNTLSNYNQQANLISPNEYNGEILLDEGLRNIHPVWSPNGEKFAYLSTKENDYFGQTDLYVYEFDGSESLKLIPGVSSAPVWLNDSVIIFSMKSMPNKNGSKYYDLYLYDLDDEKKEPKRLTYDGRLTSPSIDYISNKIAAVGISDGTSNIYIADLSEFNYSELDNSDQYDKIRFNLLTKYEAGEKIFSLSFYDNSIVFDIVEGHGRDVLKYNINSDSYIKIDTKMDIDSYALNWDERDPIYGVDGSVIYSCDRSGIYNIYYKSSISENPQNLSNVIGGAFMPSLHGSKILYSLFQDGKYKIAMIDINNDTDKPATLYSNYDVYNKESMSYKFEDVIYPKEYNQNLSKPFIFPRLLIDYGTFKPGFYFYSTDPLDKYFLFGGASINHLNDMDFLLMFEYKKLKPTLYANFYWVSRNLSREDNLISVTGDIYDNVKFRSDDTYMMFSTDLGSRLKSKLSTYSLNYNYSNYRVHLIGYQRQYHLDDYTSSPYDISYDYYRGHKLTLGYQFRKYKPRFASNMIPQNGFEMSADFSFEKNDFDPSFEVSEEYGTLSLVFSNHNTNRININIKKSTPLGLASKRISFSESWSLGFITNQDIDDFFYFFGGGLPGVKGYTFYHEELSGPGLFLSTRSISMPVFLEKNYKFMHLLFQNLSFNYIFQTGMASGYSAKYSNGIELRVNGTSFYSFPFALSYEFHFPLFDDMENDPKHYIKLLFNFLN
tara:strand:+ start:533 stop:3547 length:3015 start_codon:yes stop_codon:yes gene_type:complete